MAGTASRGFMLYASAAVVGLLGLGHPGPAEATDVGEAVAMIVSAGSTATATAMTTAMTAATTATTVLAAGTPAVTAVVTAAVLSSFASFAGGEPETCPSRTINYITHTLPQQCLRTAWSSANATAAADEGPVVVVTVGEKETEEAAESAEEDLSTGSFMSFEEWKMLQLKKAGQDPAELARRRRQQQHGRQPGSGGGGSSQADIDSLGDDGEIALDFDVLSEKMSEMAAAAELPGGAWAGGAETVEEALGAHDGEADGAAVGAAAAQTTYRSKDAGKTSKERFSFASFDAGATVLKTSKGAKNAKAILLENKDSYMLLACNARDKSVVVELSDDILVDTVVLANFEFFSSMVRRFRVSVSDRYPVKADRWRTLGEYEARNVRGIQPFLIANPQIWARYIRIDFLSHYGNEYYCPISLLRVHGTRMLDSWKESENGHDDDDDDEPEYAEEAGVAKPGYEQQPAAEAGQEKEEQQQQREAKEPQQQQAPQQAPPEDALTCPVDVPFAQTCSALSRAGHVIWPEVTASALAALSQTTESAHACASCSPTVNTGSVSDASNATQKPSSLRAQPSSSLSAAAPASAEKDPGSAAGSPPEPVHGHVEAVAAARLSSTVAAAPSVSAVSAVSVKSRQSSSTSSSASSSASSLASSTPSMPSASVSSSASTTIISASAQSSVQSSASSSSSTSTSSTASSSSTSSSSPTVQESFFKSVTKRLQLLESNSSLSLQYIEDQSRFLQDALRRMERKQIARVDGFLDRLNRTVLGELGQMRQQYDQLWQSTVLALEAQREQSQRENVALSDRLNVLADEVVFQRRMAILQSVLLLCCLVLVIFSHGMAATLPAGIPAMPGMTATSIPDSPASPYLRGLRSLYLRSPDRKRIRDDRDPTPSSPRGLFPAHLGPDTNKVLPLTPASPASSEHSSSPQQKTLPEEPALA